MTTRGLLDRLQIIAATATVTSAIWIVVGAVFLDHIGAGEAADASNGTPQIAEKRRGEPVDERLAIPVLGAAPTDLVDTFDDPRTGRSHEALDIMATAGTPVIAAGPGTIEKLHRSDAGGNTIYVRAGDRRSIHYYAHLQAYEPGLREGQAVSLGQRLGTVGSTGNADPAAPHLHFAILRVGPAAEWWESTTAINPYPLLTR